MYIIVLKHENGKSYWMHLVKALKPIMSEYFTNATMFKTAQQAEQAWHKNKALLLENIPDGEINIYIKTIHTTTLKELSI